MERKWELCFGDTTTCGAETIVKFISETEIYKRPHIVSAFAGENFSAVAVDNLLVTIFEQDVCSVNFKSTIEDVAILAGGYIAVGEKNGTLTIGVIEDDHQFKAKLSYALLSDPIGTRESTFSRVLFEITEDLKTEFRAHIICLSYDGLLMTFSDIILKDGDIDLSSVKQGKIVTPHFRAINAATMQNHIITVGAGPHCIAVYTVIDGQIILEDTASIDCEDTAESIEMMKIHTLADSDVFVTLDSQGKFYVWDAYTMIAVHTWTIADVSDFKLIQVNRSQTFSFRLSDLKLVVVKHGKVQTLTLPSLTVGSEYNCGADFAILSTTCKSFTQDEVYVTECCKVEEEDCVEVTVYFRCYREISPQKRLQRLIAKKRYEEAEKFANMFGLHFSLDPEIIQIRMREVKDTFAETAMNIIQCKQQLLKNSSRSSAVEMVLSELQEVEHRLDSYRLIYGEDNYCPMEWGTFQYESPLIMCCKLVIMNAEKAFKLWACFQADLQKQLKPGLVSQMLQRIPTSVPCQMVADWLCQDVIPFIVTSDPTAVTDIILWMEDQVRGLEMNGKGTWFDDAIQVCRSMLLSLEQAVMCHVDDVNDNNLKTIKTKMNCALALSPLKILLKLLLGLKELKTKYKCNLTLDVFRKETKESIAYRMLDGVLDVSQLSAVLNDQVLPYLKHNSIDPDEVFAKYIQDLLNRLEANHHSHLWEDKVKAIIQVIRDSKAKVTAVLNLLENTTLPLPEFVNGLVLEVISTVQHPLVTSLKEKWNIKEADNIMFLYDLNPKEVNTSFDAREAAKYVVASGGPASDAQKIMLAHKISEEDDELPMFQCQLYIMRNQVDKLAQYIKQLHKKTARKCCNFIICLAKRWLVVENDAVEQKIKTSGYQYYEAAMISASYLKTLTDDLFERAEVDKTIQIIKNAWQLGVYYGIHVSNDCLSDKLKCKTTFSMHTQTSNSTDLIGLGRLLNLKDSDILEAIISKYSEESESQALAKLLRKLALIFDTSGSLSTSLVNKLLTELSLKTISFAQCLKQAQLYLTYCSEGTFKTALEVCEQADLLNDLSVQGQERTSIEVYDFLDVGRFQVGLKSSKSGKTLSDMTEAVYAVTGDDEPLEKVLEQLETVVRDLQTAEQHAIALRVLLLLSSRLQSVAVFLPTDEKQYCLEELGNITEMARSTSSSLIVKILNTAPMDCLLAQALLLTLSRECSVPLLQTIIKSCWNNYPKLKRVNIVACAIAEIWNDQKLIDSSQRVKVIAKWGNRLSKIGISFASNTFCGIGEVMEAIRKLIQSPHCEVKILTEFFSDFNLDACKLDTVLMQFFEICLTVHSEHTLSKELLRKAEDALLCYKGNALQILKKVLQATHPYNYEVLQFLLEKIQEREDSKETLKGLELLRYLHLYKRCSPPCGTEKKKCMQHILDENRDIGSNFLPDAASSHLPFHLLQCKDNIWEVISAEINPQTLAMWLEMAVVLAIPRDNILLKASTNLIENYIKTSPSSSSRDVNEQFSQVLTTVDTILSQLEDKEKAMWWCNSTCSNLTHAGEKAVALQDCVRHAKKWFNSTDEPRQKEKAKKSVEMFFNMLQLHSTRWSLCRAGLDKERELIKLIKQPDDLIQQLYCLPCVIEDHEEQKDINTLCDEIADLHGASLLDIRKALLDKWLLGASLMDSDQTMTFDVFPEDNYTSTQDNLNRILYVLKSRDRDDLVQHLATIARMVDGLVSTTAHKTALYCVLKIGTEDEVEYLLGETN